MGRIALLVPREEMLHQAHNILQEKRYSIGEMRVIQSESTVAEARKSIAGGASIIIARGLQASLIKRYTDIPVIEIVLTAQEMALLVMRARQIVKKQLPVIAVVGFRNMFCDMSYFDELYDIRLKTYYASHRKCISQRFFGHRHKERWHSHLCSSRDSCIPSNYQICPICYRLTNQFF